MRRVLFPTRTGRRFTGALAALLLLLTMARAQSQGEPARVWEAPLVIGTYELGAPDPNPAFADWQKRKKLPVYPYPVLDDLTDRRVDKTYRAVYLENEYLRVTVLPELGGRLYEIFDKTTKRDVLYTNHVVKYALVAVRGAWISGGIEWGFLAPHTITTVSPIDYVTRIEPDGSATVTVGDTERVQGMQWAVTIRLRPHHRAVESEITLNNRRETPGRYWYWSVAAAPATEDLRFVYPIREAYTESFWPVYSFPKEKGVDIGTYREITNALNLYGRDSKRNFFGIYYEKADRGIVHVADYREIPGKIIWTWGTDEDGQTWIKKLTDADGQYVEFETGRFETMMEAEFLKPHQVEHFTEYWYPVEGLGGPYDEATPDAALRVVRRARQASITLNGTSRFDGAKLIVSASGEPLDSERVSLQPGIPLSRIVKLPEKADGKPLFISLQDREGRTLISYRTDTPVDGNAEFHPATRPIAEQPIPNSAEQPYIAGMNADKSGNDREARAAYTEALRRDPGFAPAHIALGLSFYRSGEYTQAAEHLTEALRRRPDAADAHYYLGLVRRAQKREAEAVEQFQWCVSRGKQEAAARFVLGEMALKAGNTAEAVSQLSQTVNLNPRDLKGRTMLALAERLAGRLADARREIEEVVKQMPIDYLALSEQAQVYRAQGDEASARTIADELWRLLAREPDAALELAFDYTRAGQRAEAKKVLEEATGRRRARPGTSREASATEGRDAPGDYPMLNYTLGYLYAEDGEQRRAAELFRQGAAAPPAYVFPHRVEEIAVLETAVATNQRDARAAYYLGNVLAGHGRWSEAIEAWRESARRDEPGNAVAHRNLGLALWQETGNKELAVSEYEQAIKGAPDDYHLYSELDRLLEAMGRTRQRISLLESAPPVVKNHSVVAQALADAYVKVGRFGDGLRVLGQTRFSAGEGEYTVLAIYRRAHLGLAHEHQQAGEHRQAAEEFLKATEYPANLGVGRPAMQSQAREYVAAARELEAAGRKEEAAGWWQKAANDPLNSPTQPEEPWSEHYYYKAVALEHEGRRAEAFELYRRLARLNNEEEMLKAEPSPPEGAIRFELAGAGLKALGKREQARAAFNRALAMDPGNEFARTELSELKN